MHHYHHHHQRHLSLSTILQLSILSVAGLIFAFAVFQPVQALTADELSSLISLNLTTSVKFVGDEPCLWRGIACTNSTGQIYRNINDDTCGVYNVNNNCIHTDFHVAEIRLTQPNVGIITGTLPLSAISGLRWLRVFLLNNQVGMTGSIPPFTLHPSLYHLEITNTRMNGTLPRIEARNTSIQTPYPAKIIITNNQFITGVSQEAQQTGNAEGYAEINLSNNKFTSSYFTFLPTTVETFICQSCYWEGNLTTLTPERVTSLKSVDLTGFYVSGVKRGLYGSIAPLFHPTASRLENVILSTNKFSSSGMENNTALPAPALKSLTLDSNEFITPPNLSKATNLQLFNFNYNPLTINIDTFIQPLLNNNNNLQSLSCANCRLTGPMPTLSPSMVASLVSVSLPNNMISGSYASFFHPTASKLEVLDMSFNQLDVEVPSIPSSPIYTLRLENNQIPGRGPLIRGSSLIDLIFHQNLLTSFPNISTHTKLININLSLNPYNTTITSFFASMPSSGLRSLVCVECALTGPIPSLSPEFLASIIEIDLSQNAITGSIAPLFHPTASALKTIKLNNNKLDQPLPSIIPAANLLTFECENNLIPGAAPFFTGESLYSLDMSNNLLSGPTPNVSQHRNLEVLSLDFNRFTSVEISSLSRSIKNLSLGNNSLTQFPLWLMNADSRDIVSRLRILKFGSNKLSGLMPDVCNGDPISILRASITEIDVSSNGYTGRVPSFFNCTRITSLSLQNNEFTSLPDTWPSRIKYMDASSNFITGDVPIIDSTDTAQVKIDCNFFTPVDPVVSSVLGAVLPRGRNEGGGTITAKCYDAGVGRGINEITNCTQICKQPTNRVQPTPTPTTLPCTCNNLPTVTSCPTSLPTLQPNTTTAPPTTVNGAAAGAHIRIGVFGSFFVTFTLARVLL